MKASLSSFLAIVAMTFFSACSHLEPDHKNPDGPEAPINISVTASDGTPTRGIITGTSLPDGSQIGLTFCDISGTTYQGKKYENISYTAEGSGSAQTWDTSSPIMVANTPGTLYGYYPQSSPVTDIRKIPLTADSSTQTDYMYAEPVGDITKANPSAQIVMKHALAAIRLNVMRGTYSGTGSVSAASVSGADIPTSAVLDARTGELSSYKGYSTAISPSISSFTLSQSGSYIDILTIPCGNSSDVNVSLTIDGNRYETTINDAQLRQGTMTECKITVNDGGVSVTSVNVTAWKQNSAGSQIVQNDYKVTFEGDMDGLSFSNSVDDEGNVTILAVPYISKDAETKPVTIVGTATLEQSVDDKTGVLTIRLSDIASDVSVIFDGFYLWITVTHNVTDISSTTKIYNSGTPIRIKMDGTEIGTDKQYQFETTGEHIMKIAFDNYKVCPGSFFYYTGTVTEAVFPEGVEEIGSWSFLGCTNFKKVSLPSTLKKLHYQCFERSGLVSAEIPDGCWMNYGVFSGCTSLTSVKLPSYMESIPALTFDGCTSLTSFEFPEGVKSIGYNAFYGTGLEKIHFPDAVTVLESQVCKSCSNLKEVKLPASLTKIDYQAFSFCESLERIILSDGTVCTEEFIIPEGVTDIGEIIIYRAAPGIKKIRIPTTLQNIHPRSFTHEQFEGFTMVTPHSTYDIRNNALVETVTNILVSGGTQCGKVHESVTEIGAYAFESSAVETIDLHAGITMLHDNAFDYSKPSVIISRSTTPPAIGNMPFRLSNYTGTVKVPAESITLYRSQWYLTDVGYLGWSNFRWGLTALTEGE